MPIPMAGRNLNAFVQHRAFACCQVMGYAAMVTLKGIFGAFRVKVLQAPAVTIQFEHGQTLPGLLSGMGGLSAHTLQLVLTGAIALAILIFVFVDKEFRKSLDNNLSGIILGLLVVGGWYLTGHVGLAENPDTLEMTYFGTNSHLAESMSFIAPAAYTLEYWAYWTDASNIVTFGVATVFGVGKTYFWPTMLGVTSEQFPRGGALLQLPQHGEDKLRRGAPSSRRPLPTRRPKWRIASRRCRSPESSRL